MRETSRREIVLLLLSVLMIYGSLMLIAYANGIADAALAQAKERVESYE